jgi:hypothetical protein
MNNYDGHQQNFGQQQPIHPGQAVPNQGQPGMPVPPKQKKPFFKRTWVIVTGSIIAVIIVISAVNGGGSPATDNAGADVPSGGVTSSDKPVAKETTKPAETKPAAKKWVKLLTLTGSADKQSDTIKTTGGKIRITHTFKDTTSVGGIGAIYFLKEGTDLQTDGGIPEIMVSEAGKDVTTLRKGAGEYFVKISAANFKYTVIVEEER